MVQKEIFFKGRETLFEYAVCCFSKKKGFSLPYNPSFPKNFNYEQYRILLVVKKFRKRGV